MNKGMIVFSRILGVALIFMVALNAANAMGRYFFGRAIHGADELLIYSMIWIVFLGAGLVAKRDKHLGFDLLEKINRSYRARRLLFFLYNGLTCLVAFFIVSQSTQVIEKVSRIGQKSMALELPMEIPHSAVFFGMLLIGIVSGVRVAIASAEEVSKIIKAGHHK